MDDLISRKAVLSYIDRILTQGTGKKKSFEFIRKHVELMPSAQTEIIRCKDCGWNRVCRFGQYLGLNGYCSKAERRTNG